MQYKHCLWIGKTTGVPGKKLKNVIKLKTTHTQTSIKGKDTNPDFLKTDIKTTTKESNK